MISKRRDYRGRKCTTVLLGGVCHRTSPTHKCGSKMKRKKKINLYACYLPFISRIAFTKSFGSRKLAKP